MNPLTLLFDPEQESFVREKLLPRLEGQEVQPLPFTGALPAGAAAGSTLLA